MEKYHLQIKRSKEQILKLKQELNLLSLLRFLVIGLSLVMFYIYFQEKEKKYLLIGMGLIGVFLVVLKFFDRKKEQKNYHEALLEINENEVAFLDRGIFPLDDGSDWKPLVHAYAHDLDIFGKKSLYHYLNRCYTYVGKKSLAANLLDGVNDIKVLNEKQEAVRELVQKIDWRQHLMALAKMGKDQKEFYVQLLQWKGEQTEEVSKVSKILSYLSPAVFLIFLFLYIETDKNEWLGYMSMVFIFNLVFFLSFLGRIKRENNESGKITKITKQYGKILSEIEKTDFESSELKYLQKKLENNSGKASQSLTKLSKLFSWMDSVANPPGAIILNGCFLFHLHGFNKLIEWKKKHQEAIENWLEVIGEVEMYSSLAHFSYNNPDYVFPTLNNDFELQFHEIAHPLLPKEARVGNDLSFEKQGFVILTGSNMSGKSTFLRSLGVNMVLARMGAALCAKEATVHPLPILVSMRLSDSLTDNESYFYAEIKRLKEIMETLNETRAFVLLDEILRGTNSDDKQEGTLSVIKKMKDLKALGVIATHDVEVCLLANEYPNDLANMCFEATIEKDNLFFDYRLRAGVCKNKSATFLMNKMGVI